jgi:propionate CoA-transferase
MQDGKTAKFVPEVEHRTFSGDYALRREQPVLYITERCVFRLTADGLELIEVAPGIDLDRDILARMQFRPIIRHLRPMDARIFRDEPMALREAMLSLPIESRFAYDAEKNLFFINFERLSLRSEEDVERIRNRVEAMLAPLQRKVLAIANYDHFTIPDEFVDDYAATIHQLTTKYYSNVTRYTTSSFLRMKLGAALETRGAAPHIYMTADEARAHLADGASPL